MDCGAAESARLVAALALDACSWCHLAWSDEHEEEIPRDMTSLQYQSPGSWQSNAACAGDMGSMFYPPVRAERKGLRVSRERRAKAVCTSCPVRDDCLDHALVNDERYGIWGGMTGKERRLASRSVA